MSRRRADKSTLEARTIALADSLGRATHLLRAAAALAVVVVSGLALPGEGAWAAGVRYAGAQGSGPACARDAPCAIDDALAGAVAGETVVLLSAEGPYGSAGMPLAATLTVPEGVTVEGAFEEARPVVNSAAAAGLRLGPEASITGVDLSYTGSGPALEAGEMGAVSRTLVESTATAPACELGGGATVANTVCAGTVAMRASAAPATVATVSLRNDTLVGAQRGLEAIAANAAALVVEGHNSILRGGTVDVFAEEEGSGTASLQFAASSFASVEAKPGTTITAPGSGGNQAAAPHFVDAAAGDFMELGDSPTIDAGENDPANGPVDLLGNPRASPGHLNCAPPPPAITDIGAYEFQSMAPPCGRPYDGPIPVESSGRPRLTPVPGVRGMQLGKAVARLQRRGFGVSVAGRRSPCRPGSGSRRVRAQRPGAKALVSPGSQVRVVVNCIRR